MNFLDQRNIGLNFHPEPTITVWAPYANKLSIDIERKDTIPLQKQEKGFWFASLPDIEPGDHYRLTINKKDSFPDPASLSQPQGVHLASQAIDLIEIRKIHDNTWKGIPVKDMIIYELHTGTFTPEGTFAGVEKKLDYLKDLGVNAIKILPVATFPGERNWGYDGVFPFAVQPSYGGAFEFAQLVKAAHEKGIAVILDVVYNHLGPEGNYLGAFGPVFTGKYTTPWGKAINFDDAWCDGVRQFFIENALMWLRDFHVDGLRLDAVHAIKDFGPKHFLQELSEQVNKLNVRTRCNHFLIAECDLNDTRYITQVHKGGYGMDAQWCDEWHHSLHALLTGEKTGYYEDFGTIEHLEKSLNHAYVYTGNFSHHRKKSFGSPTNGLPGERFVVFTQNHDQVGNRMNGDRLSTLIDFESLKLAAGAMMITPFIPMIFMGEEYAEDNPFLYFVSHGDEHLLEAVRKGRKREFRDFMNNATPPDPADVKTFESSGLKWDHTDNKHKSQMLMFYKSLIALRKQYRLLPPGNRENISTRGNKDEKTILMVHKAARESIVSVMNFSKQNTVTELPLPDNKTSELLIYSAHKQWGGKIKNSIIPLQKKQNTLLVETSGKSIVIFKLINSEE